MSGSPEPEPALGLTPRALRAAAPLAQTGAPAIPGGAGVAEFALLAAGKGVDRRTTPGHTQCVCVSEYTVCVGVCTACVGEYTACAGAHSVYRCAHSGCRCTQGM